MRTVVYAYGLRPPVSGREHVADQMRRAHVYRNQLIELDRERRESIRKLEIERTREHYERATAARSKLLLAIQSLSETRSKDRARTETEEQREAISAARKELHAAMAVWWEALKPVRKAMTAERDELAEKFTAARRGARANCGVYWGTYQLAEEATMHASQTPLWDGLDPSDPKFSRWTGEGTVSAQIQKGDEFENIEKGRNNYVQLQEDLTPSKRDPNSNRSKRTRRVLLKLRVGSDKAKPVWAVWPMLLSRSIPADARIKRVSVKLRMIGPREEWTAMFVLDLPDPVPKLRPDVVAVDLGWRQHSDGSMRVGMVMSSSGRVEEITLSESLLGGLRYPERLRSIRDKNLEEMRPKFAAMIDAIGKVQMFPLWFVERIETIEQWRSQARFAALAVHWRTNRFDGDTVAFDYLEAWRKQDKHLWSWETSQRVGSLRSRRDHYRCVAARLARTHGTLVLEQFDLRAIARSAAPEADADNQTARGNRQLAAPSELRLVLRNAFEREGGRIVEVSAKNTTRQCSTCGVIEAFDASANLRHTCANGHPWDQDENAAANLLDRYRQLGPDVDTPDKPRESPRDRTRRLANERKQRLSQSPRNGHTVADPVREAKARTPASRA